MNPTIDRKPHPLTADARPPEPLLRTPEVGWTTIGLFLAVHLFLILLILTVLRPGIVAVQFATGHLVHQDLLAAAILFVVAVGGVLFALGGLRPADVGLVRSGIRAGVLVAGGLWLAIQVVLVAASLLSGGSLQPHPDWSRYGVTPILSFFVAMLVGMALVEEVSFRGFLFPQLYHKLRGSGRRRLWAAVLLSQLVFALVHIPTRLLLGHYSGPALLPEMMVLTLAGVFGVLLYLRTENLFVVTSVHALVNAPTPLVASPASPFTVTILLSIALLLVWPRLIRKNR